MPAPGVPHILKQLVLREPVSRDPFSVRDYSYCARRKSFYTCILRSEMVFGHGAKGRKSARLHCLEVPGARQTDSFLGGVALPPVGSACKAGEADGYRLPCRLL